jgi:hypothetical protein
MENLVVDRRPQAEELERSVLFSDVVASTEFIDRRDEIAWLTLVDRHARAVCAVARHHGGEVVSFLGDGFMLMFAEASDALQCALRLQTASRTQDLVHIRIGLAHGLVFRYRDDWYVGRTIQVASRLADLCQDDLYAELDDDEHDPLDLVQHPANVAPYGEEPPVSPVHGYRLWSQVGWFSHVGWMSDVGQIEGPPPDLRRRRLTASSRKDSRRRRPPRRALRRSV